MDLKKALYDLKKEKAFRRLFHETLTFYSKVTGYNFPLKPLLKTFRTRKEFDDYHTQPGIICHEPPEAAAGMCVLISCQEVIVCVDLSDEDLNTKWMAPYTFFHEYEHVRRHVTERGVTYSYGRIAKIKRLKEEKEVILAATTITEKFLGVKLPAEAHKIIENGVRKMTSMG